MDRRCTRNLRGRVFAGRSAIRQRRCRNAFAAMPSRRRTGPRSQPAAISVCALAPPSTSRSCFERFMDKFSRSRGAVARELCRPTRSNSQNILPSPPGLTRWSMLTGGSRDPTEDQNPVAAWIAGSSPAMTKARKPRKKDAERRQTQSGTCRAAGTAAHPAGCARLSAFHHGSRQRDLSSQRLSFRPGFLGRGRSARSGKPAPTGERRSCAVQRALPAPACPSPGMHLPPRS